MLYTYVCKKCNKEKEMDHPMREDPEVICECGEKMYRPVFGGAATHFKGYGWSKVNNGETPIKQTTSYHGPKINKEG